MKSAEANPASREQSADETDGAPRPKLSLILCTGNDSYQGNSVWRLQTALNYTAEAAAEVGRLDEVEIVVGDWGSETPVRDALSLTPEAARIARFVTIPPRLHELSRRTAPSLRFWRSTLQHAAREVSTSDASTRTSS